MRKEITLYQMNFVDLNRDIVMRLVKIVRDNEKIKNVFFNYRFLVNMCASTDHRNDKDLL
jgi:hypothetical protein